MFNSSQDEPDSQQNQENSPFFSMDQPVFTSEEPEEPEQKHQRLDLSPQQRAIIMILIFVLTLVGGTLCLLLSGKIVL